MEGTREKVVPFSVAGCHHAGFMPAHMKKAARAYMLCVCECASEGEGGF